MTTVNLAEESFQAVLDADRQDWNALLAFADWLRDRGDPRADGCQVMATLHIYQWSPVWKDEITTFSWWNWDRFNWDEEDEVFWRHAGELSEEWWGLIGRHEPTSINTQKKFPTRRHADYAAWIAFASLPADRREFYLSLRRDDR